MKDSLVYLTPWHRIGEQVFGAAYDKNGLIIPISLRRSGKAGLKPGDPAYLSSSSMCSAKSANQEYKFLGHAFGAYGHFLLETLPMLLELVLNPNANGIFLPWGGDSRRRILDHFLDLLSIKRTRAHIHVDQFVLNCKLDIIPRPIAINDPSSIHLNPYRQILCIIKSNVNQTASLNSSKLIFLSRKSNRVSPMHTNLVESFAQNIGFQIIRPEKISLHEQIQIMSTATVVAGFSGSQLHNSMFCSANTIVIELGDTRKPLMPNPNQVVCSKISGGKLRFVPYNEIPAIICQGLNDQLSSIKY